MIFDRQDGVLPGRIISIDLGTGEPAEPVFPRDPKTASLNDAAVGDIIWFGHYPGISAAEDSQDPLPVPWLVLDRTSEDLLLISRDALDSRPYHGEFRDVVWEDCDLRKWLNGEFLHSFFSAAEQKRILVSHLANDDNPEYRTSGGGATSDRIFCLSLSEAGRYFADDASRRCGPAERAVRKGLWANEEGHCYWWLRTPGRYGFNAAATDPFGELWPDGNTVNGEDHGGVRPAMRIFTEPLSSNPG